MPKLIFHIGHHKTGTTALQFHLAQNRRPLARLGVLYPRLPGWKYAHHALFPHLFDVEHCDPYVLRHLGSNEREALEASRKAWYDVCSSVTSQDPGVVVLSSETFFRAGSCAQMARLGQTLREIFDEIEIACYVRNPAELLLALFSTQIQVGAEFEWPPPDLRKAVLQAYEKVGAELIRVVKYSSDSLEGGDIKKDFSSRFIGRALDHRPPLNRVNQSLSPEAMVVMERYVVRHNAPINRAMPLRQQIFRRVLKEVDQFLGNSQKSRLLPSAEASILDSCTDLHWLESNYDISWPRVPESQRDKPARVVYGEKISLQDICHFDLDRFTRIRKIMSFLGA